MTIQNSLSNFIRESLAKDILSVISPDKLSHVSIEGNICILEFLIGMPKNVFDNPFRNTDWVIDIMEKNNVTIRMKEEYSGEKQVFGLSGLFSQIRQPNLLEKIILTIEGIKSTMKKKPEVILVEQPEMKIRVDRKTYKPLSLDPEELMMEFSVGEIESSTKRLRAKIKETVESNIKPLYAYDAWTEMRNAIIMPIIRPEVDLFSSRPYGQQASIGYRSTEFVFCSSAREFDEYQRKDQMKRYDRNIYDKGNRRYVRISDVNDLRGLKGTKVDNIEIIYIPKDIRHFVADHHCHHLVEYLERYHGYREYQDQRR